MKQSFFSKDPVFYRSFFKLMAVIALQNLVAYSVNMLDNMIRWAVTARMRFPVLQQ